MVLTMMMHYSYLYAYIYSLTRADGGIDITFHHHGVYYVIKDFNVIYEIKYFII